LANGSVSFPLSSNRTWGFAASGFPTEFMSGYYASAAPGASTFFGEVYRAISWRVNAASMAARYAVMRANRTGAWNLKSRSLRNGFQKIGIRAIEATRGELNPRLAGRPPTRRKDRDFSIFFHHNPLKSPDSDE
jgi:hypothetical protein